MLLWVPPLGAVISTLTCLYFPKMIANSQANFPHLRCWHDRKEPNSIFFKEPSEYDMNNEYEKGL